MDISLNNSLSKLEEKLDKINDQLEINTQQRQQLIASHQLLVRMIIEVRDKVRTFEVKRSKSI